MKKLITILLAACTMLGSLSFQGISTVTGMADDGVMRDNMTAQDYADDMGLGINLGNTMESYNAANCTSLSYQWPPIIGSNTPRDYETTWGAVVTNQEIINGMKNAGFNTIRIPVFWGNMMVNDGTYTISDAYMNRVKEIVDYCRNAGVYAVINIHHFDEFIIRRNTKEKSAEIFKRIWTQIASYFKDYSDYLIFEGFNEYLGGGQIDSNNEINDLPESEGFDWTNKMNQAFVDAVRATGGNNEKRMLIVSGYFTNVEKTTNSAFKMPVDTAKDRMMVSVHYVDGNAYWSKQIGSKFWKLFSISQLNLLKKSFTEKGIPVFIGETTSIYDNDRFSENASVKSTSEALDYLMRLIKSYGFVPVLWDVNDNFYSRTQCKIKSKADAEVIERLFKEITDGTFVPIDTSYFEPMAVEDALGVISYGDIPLNLASGTADASMEGAVKIRYVFDCAADVSFNLWAGINLSANVAGKESKITVTGENDIKGETAIEVILDLSNQIKNGDSYSVYASTYSWGDAKDYVYLIRCIEFLDASGNIIKTIGNSNRPTEPSSNPSSNPNLSSPSETSSKESSDNSDNSSDNSSNLPSDNKTDPTTAPTTAKPAAATTAPKATTNAKAVKAAKDKANAEKVMKQAKIKKLTAKVKGNKKIVVSWKKVKNAKGYKVQVAINKKFKKNKIIVTKNVKGKKVTIKSNKIKRRKTYYIRVRAYTTYQDANGVTQKVYSSWIKKTWKVKVR